MRIDPVDRGSTDLILQWSAVSHDAFLAHDGYFSGNFAVRTFAVMHLAQHDAVNGAEPRYETYAFSVIASDARSPPSRGSACTPRCGCSRCST